MVREIVDGATSRNVRSEAIPAWLRPRCTLTLATLEKIMKRPGQKSGKRKPWFSVVYRDQSDYGYSWLLPGWVAEERRMITGRRYTYYYDPSGRQYNTKIEVLHMWAMLGLYPAEAI